MGARWDSGALAVGVTDDQGYSYTYLANSMLVGQITFRHTTNVMITTRQYDWVNRLRQTISSPTGPNQPPWVHGYEVNAADQRTRIALGDGSCWVFEYDSLGQVKTGKRYWSDGTPARPVRYEHEQLLLRLRIAQHDRSRSLRRSDAGSSAAFEGPQCGSGAVHATAQTAGTDLL
jgi:hypothetical protein